MALNDEEKLIQKYESDLRSHIKLEMHLKLQYEAYKQWSEDLKVKLKDEEIKFKNQLWARNEEIQELKDKLVWRDIRMSQLKD